MQDKNNECVEQQQQANEAQGSSCVLKVCKFLASVMNVEGGEEAVMRSVQAICPDIVLSCEGKEETQRYIAHTWASATVLLIHTGVLKRKSSEDGTATGCSCEQCGCVFMVRTNDGDVVCEECGQVAHQILLVQPEFSDEGGSSTTQKSLPWRLRRLTQDNRVGMQIGFRNFTESAMSWHVCSCCPAMREWWEDRSDSMKKEHMALVEEVAKLSTATCEAVFGCTKLDCKYLAYNVCAALFTQMLAQHGNVLLERAWIDALHTKDSTTTISNLPKRVKIHTQLTNIWQSLFALRAPRSTFWTNFDEFLRYICRQHFYLRTHMTNKSLGYAADYFCTHSSVLKTTQDNLDLVHNLHPNSRTHIIELATLIAIRCIFRAIKEVKETGDAGILRFCGNIHEPDRFNYASNQALACAKKRLYWDDLEKENACTTHIAQHQPPGVCTLMSTETPFIPKRGKQKRSTQTAPQIRFNYGSKKVKTGASMCATQTLESIVLRGSV